MAGLKKISEYVWEVPKEGDMKLPGRVYADSEIIGQLKEEEESGGWSALKQIRNVACLPGLQKYSLALADVHPGYGAPIGGVVAMGMEQGVITFGAVGFDINCGVRTLSTPLKKEDVVKVQEKLADSLFRNVPAGLGSTGDIKINSAEVDEVLVQGAEFSVNQGYGFREDLEFIEENGRMEGADPGAVSEKAKQREHKQVGTLGSGNHYLEVQYVSEVYDEQAARAYGLSEGQVLVSLHCGSRGLGHQIGTDYLKELDTATRKYKIPIKDRELVCAPIGSEEGQKYFSAVCAGINGAFANRQAIAHLTRKAFTEVMGLGEKEMKTVYEVGHNTVKKEKHKIDGKKKEVLVHRKGSTRGFGPGRKEVPEAYRKVGQPILVGGTMGTSSYVLAGTEKGMEETFGSAIHGAGRKMSRVKATKSWRAEDIVEELKDKGIIVKGHGFKGIAEEAPGAYKDVVSVVDVMHNAGIVKKVVQVKPLISIKG